MSETTKKSKIFISFSFLDEDFAIALSNYFKEIIGEKNFTLYCAALNNNHNATQYGADFSEDFIKNVNDCDVFIPLLSLNYKRSISSIVELGAALGSNKIIAPLILPGCDYSDFNNIYNLRNRDYYSIDSLDGIQKLLKLLSDTIKFDSAGDFKINEFINSINEIKKIYIAHISEVTQFSFECTSFSKKQDYDKFFKKLKETKMLECSVMIVNNNKVRLCNLYLCDGYHLTEFKKFVETEKLSDFHISLLD